MPENGSKAQGWLCLWVCWWEIEGCHVSAVVLFLGAVEAAW